MANDQRINLKVDQENSRQLRELSETIKANSGLTKTLNSLGNDALAMGIRCLARNQSPRSKKK